MRRKWSPYVNSGDTLIKQFRGQLATELSNHSRYFLLSEHTYSIKSVESFLIAYWRNNFLPQVLSVPLKRWNHLSFSLSLSLSLSLLFENPPPLPVNPVIVARHHN